MRTRRPGMVLGLAILAMGIVGCDNDADPLAPAEDVDITGAWSFTPQATNPVMVTSCTTDDLTAQFADDTLCDFGLTIDQTNGSFTATSTTMATCDIELIDGTLTQSPIIGTSSPIMGEALWGSPPIGAAAGARFTFEGGATNDEMIITPGTLWDADDGPEPKTVCAGQQDFICEDDEECAGLNVCQVFLASAGKGGFPPLEGTCSSPEDSDTCILACEVDQQQGCTSATEASTDCPSNGTCNQDGECSEDTSIGCKTDDDCLTACIDILDACESPGPCIEATCSLSGSFVAMQ